MYAFCEPALIGISKPMLTKSVIAFGPPVIWSSKQRVGRGSREEKEEKQLWK